jgi:hypothetical protein
LDVTVANDLNAVAPGVAEVEERTGQYLDARLGQGSADGVLIVDDEAEVATVIGRLAASLLKRDELVTEVNESHFLAFPADLEIEYPGIERERFLNVAHFKCNVIETHGARFFDFRHGILLGRAMTNVDKDPSVLFHHQRWAWEHAKSWGVLTWLR